jgi:antagonist of KipI
MEVIVRQPGAWTTLQDLGREHDRTSGVPVSGAMDRLAHRVANLLVGNTEEAATLEFTMAGPVLEFPSAALVAVTGAEVEGVPMGQPFTVAAGQSLQLTRLLSGCRGYLAIAGGWHVTQVLGSASTYVRGGFGGLDGRILRPGDRLHAAEVTRQVVGRWHIDPALLPRCSGEPVVRILPGAEADGFDAPLVGESFRVSPQSDPMGVRLTGPQLRARAGHDARSRAVLPGTIQVPPDGQPIILGADAQTLGGYPQIAHVIEVDLPLVAQLRPGDRVRFAFTTIAAAHELTLARERALSMLREGLALKLR